MEQPAQQLPEGKRRIPVVIKGVNLTLDVVVEGNEVKEKLADCLKLVEEAKAQFGESTTLDKLALILSSGAITLHEVKIDGGIIEQRQAAPLTVSVPQAAPVPKPFELRMYRIITPHPCPITGYHLKDLEPGYLQETLHTKEAFLHPQDVQMMKAYLVELGSQPVTPKPPMQQAISFEEDDIAF